MNSCFPISSMGSSSAKAETANSESKAIDEMTPISVYRLDLLPHVVMIGIDDSVQIPMFPRVTMI